MKDKFVNYNRQQLLETFKFSKHTYANIIVTMKTQSHSSTSF